jgi:hypothetical protein
MPDVRITCIVKPDRFSPHEHITDVGNCQASPPWKSTREQVISWIEAGTYTFYVQDDQTGRRATVGVVGSRGSSLIFEPMPMDIGMIICCHCQHVIAEGTLVKGNYGEGGVSVFCSRSVHK